MLVFRGRISANNDYEVVVLRDAGREVGGGFGFEVVFGFEGFLGAWLGVVERIECIVVGIFVCRSVVDRNICVIFVFEGFLLGAGATWRFGAIQDENGSVFVDRGVIAEHFSDVVLDSSVVACATGWQDVRDAIDGASGHERFGF